MGNKIAGILIVLVGIKVLFIQDWYGNWINYNFSNNFLYIPVGLLCLYIGFLFLKINNKKTIEFSKCPKCKESYRYETLKDGICPTCNIKTIETQEYFKKYPQELDDI